MKRDHTEALRQISNLYTQLDTLCAELGEAIDEESDRQLREELDITDAVRGQAPSMLAALREVPHELRYSSAWRHDFDIMERLLKNLAY